LALSPDLNMPRSKGMVIGLWIVTAFFCLQMGFTAYAQLRLPQVAEAFTHLGFPAYFRLPGGAFVRQAPRRGAAPWVFAPPLGGGPGPEAWGWAAATGVLWGLSYFFWRRLQATPASA
jgi:hypothetical protein